MDTDAFDLQEIKKSCAIFLCFDILSSWHCHLFILHHYKWHSFEIGCNYGRAFAMKTTHNTTVIQYKNVSNKCEYYIKQSPRS